MHATEQDRPDVAQARQALREKQPELLADKLVFVDETWTKTNMTRTHGRCPRGQRLIAKVPHGRWQTTTLIAAIRRSGIFAPMVVDGPVNAEVFTAYAEQCLAPALQPGDIVMLDHLSSHKGSAIDKAITDRHASLEFLPKYSPDLNPIEPAFGQIKAHLRKAARRTPEALMAATAIAIQKVKAQHCSNYFTAYGYSAT
ncbi:MAG: IS630 family transposase [Gammaproteobacteria bacterium]